MPERDRAICAGVRPPGHETGNARGDIDCRVITIHASGSRDGGRSFFVGSAARAQRAVLTLGVRQRIEHLVDPMLFAEELVVLQAHRGGILARDVRGAEQHVPQEQQVAVV